MVKPELFPTFFTKTKGINAYVPIQFNVNYFPDSFRPDKEEVKPQYYPIDNKGLDELPGMGIYRDLRNFYHNFHFCIKIHAFFTYGGSEIFTVQADDDVWVYINNSLVLDISGYHTLQTVSVNIPGLGLSQGQTYPLDYFYCNRYTPSSSLAIKTTMTWLILWTDYCGISNGDGSCCEASDDCNDDDLCTIDTCPSPLTNGANSTNFRQYCNHTRITCDEQTKSDLCFQHQCEGGKCVVGARKTCPHITCHVDTSCDQELGCQYEPLCRNDICHTVQCVPGNETTSDTCTRSPIDCTGKDKYCMDYASDPELGCTSKPKQCGPPINSTESKCMRYYCTPGVGCQSSLMNQTECDCCDPTLTPKCKVATCNVTTGNCDYTDVSMVSSDDDPCQVGHCNPDTGVITFKPVVCNGCQTCSRASGATQGQCVDTDSLCTSPNQCNVGSCQSGECKTTLKSCDDGDPCTVDSCNILTGCDNSQPVVCADQDLCHIGQCTPGVGCTSVDRTCPTESFCIDSICDLRSGCVTFARQCTPPDSKCQSGTCNNSTRMCEFRDISPVPFGCNKAAVISTGVAAGVIVAGAIVIGILVFGAKKGYDFWRVSSTNDKITSLNSNPLYDEHPSANGANPLYVEQIDNTDI
ncbi:hypothetical protein SAMD00019534_056450 [Acytostelium subglobosum LB1]|uniref:hypothetical protein n=1 Tax=Acytostelium subglobosum LB1 TaxID=1410327 RepID=UPI000644D8BB|nr:hypothetical protein SAMD00019534_056450 [Acytostelium subglobosum LB1]GAM22470.1 hypothetical protein SAMD00019534_056450 [Acytostelium subglobosum LB1]|eukprot:XP_012754590.1 hypothetical protein SAMD00019534_056450 [Acytostelium subglobosum LB1]